MKIASSVFALPLVLVLLASDAAAVSQAGGIAMQFNTSASAEGMGGAGVASWWGQSPTHWANPALLSKTKGLHYNGFYSKLVPDFADDVSISNHELTLGAFGVGFLYGRSPLPGVKLDQGEQTGVDARGNVRTFSSHQEVRKLGVGLDLAQAFDSVLDWKGSSRGLSHFATLALGITHKEFLDQLAPDELIQDGFAGSGEGSCKDYGVLIRFSPSALALLAVDRLSEPPAILETIEPRIEGLYGHSWMSWTEEEIVFSDAGQSDPFPRQTVSGWALNAEIAAGPRLAKELERSRLGPLAAGISPLFSLRYADQTIDSEVEGDETVIEGHGWEVGLLNLLYIRRGRIDDPEGDVVGNTRGWGINLQLGMLGGLRYDVATVPQATGLATVDREAWSVWLRPLEIRRHLRD